MTFRAVKYRGVTYRGVTSVAPVLSCCDGEICPGSEEFPELHFSINSTNCDLKMSQDNKNLSVRLLPEEQLNSKKVLLFL